MKLFRNCILCIAAAILMVLAINGCRDKSDAPTIHLLRGRVTKIDAASGIVTGKFWNKKNEEMDLSGKLAPDAEIMIDGRTATLEDVQIGDEVEVEGFEEKQGDERRMIAKKVTVKRSTPGTQPVTTTRPAAGASTR
jgi:hypothetical protein